jgi:phospholipid transport system substrate-binding protein
MRNNWLIASILSLPLVGILPTTAQTVNATTAPATVADASKAQTPAQFIQALAEEVFNSINGKRLSDAETTARFRTLLQKAFDLKSIGRFELGPYWNTATEQERTDYQQAFENMIVNAYALRFRDYSGASFKAGRSIPQGKDTQVDSQITPQTGAPPIDVSWKIRPENGGYKIVDVAVEGVSMGNTEKAEFASIIERNGGKVQALIDAMKNNQVGLGDQNQ